MEGDSRGHKGRSVLANIIKVGKDIDKTRLFFSDSFRKQLGNKVDIKFWEDSWTILGRFKEKFRQLYQLESNRGVLVAGRGEFRHVE